MRILYYAHHHGTGHLRHARRVQQSGVAEVLVVGGVGADVQLPPDVDPAHPHREPADSPFHWTPRTPQLRRRFSELHRVLDDFAPDLVMVDVSVEAAVFSALAGYPVAHRRMPGHRDDAPHQLGYATARRLFAYYPRSVEAPGYQWAERTSWLGMVSDAKRLAASGIEPGTVVVLSGAGGDGVSPGQLAAAARATPEHTWHVLGPESPERSALPGNVVHHGWVPNPSRWLARAEVVVCGAGHNTVATVAGCQRPVVLAPEPRPHDEQVVFAEQLHRSFGVPVVTDWETADWSRLLAHPGDARALSDGLLVTPQAFAGNLRGFLAEVLDQPEELDQTGTVGRAS